ncbi:MAG: hypothetical protein WBE21_15045 [Candidatus Acidiferrales bacterium]
MRRKRWFLCVLWFVALFIWNMVAQRHQYSDAALVHGLHVHEVLALGAGVNGTGTFKQVMEAIGYMTSPVELLISALVVLVVLTKRKPLADR